MGAIASLWHCIMSITHHSHSHTAIDCLSSRTWDNVWTPWRRFSFSPSRFGKHQGPRCECLWSNYVTERIPFVQEALSPVSGLQNSKLSNHNGSLEMCAVLLWFGLQSREAIICIMYAEQRWADGWGDLSQPWAINIFLRYEYLSSLGHKRLRSQLVNHDSTLIQYRTKNTYESFSCWVDLLQLSHL